jgi:hypothetical protein
MKELRLNSGLQEDLLKVVVNDDDEAIYLNPNDGTFVDRFAKFLAWIDAKSKELDKLGTEKAKEYEGRAIFGEDGAVDVEQLLELTNVQLEAVKEIAAEVDNLFGQDTLRKFFKPYYTINPDFVPDADCINDFLEQIIPAVNAAYDARLQRIQSKYSKGRRRKGGGI